MSSLNDGPITVSILATDTADNTATGTGDLLHARHHGGCGHGLALSAANPAGGASTTEVSITLSGIDSDITSGTITLSDGVHTATHTLTAAEIAAIAAGAGSVTLGASAFTGGDGFAALNHADNLITVSASVTDDTGNQAAPPNQTFTLDTTADAGTALALSAANPTGGASTTAVSITLSGIDSDITSGTITLERRRRPHRDPHADRGGDRRDRRGAGTVTLGADAFTGGRL